MTNRNPAGRIIIFFIVLISALAYPFLTYAFPRRLKLLSRRPQSLTRQQNQNRFSGCCCFP